MFRISLIYIYFFIFFFRPPALVGRVLWNRICPSFHPSVCPGFFLELYHYFFLNFSMRLQTHMKLCMTEPDFPEKIFLSQKFLNMLKSFVINFYWICWVMKIYIICCVPAQIPYLGKLWFLRYGPKCFQTIRLQDFLINHISRTNRWNSLIFCMLIQIHISSRLIKKFLDGLVKWVWPVWSRDSKIGCISRMNRWDELISGMLVQIQES